VGRKGQEAEMMVQVFVFRPCHAVTARKMARISTTFSSQRFQFPKAIVPL